MNKLVKGSIAAAAATLLLLGGAGSLAYWNDQAELGGGQITAGALDIGVSGAQWSNSIPLWVPGDSNTFTANLAVVATGTHMKGEITIDKSSIVVTPAEQADQFTITVDKNGDLPDGVSFIGGKFTFTGPVSGTIPVKVTVEFPYGSAGANGSQGATVNLSGISFTATQSNPNP